MRGRPRGKCRAGGAFIVIFARRKKYNIPFKRCAARGSGLKFSLKIVKITRYSKKIVTFVLVLYG